MRRITISIEKKLADALDVWVRVRGYATRSEAVRDFVRGGLAQAAKSGVGSTHCVAALSYVFNHHQRDLAERLIALQHSHHDLTISAMHVHLDHELCLETVMLKGRADAVRAFADSVSAERGVRNAQLNLVPAEPGHPHSHVDGRAPHRHLTPKH